jgi:hypothetical protein
MDTIGSSFRPWLSCQGICLLNRHQTGDTDSVQPGILLPVQRDSQETFIPCEARMLWYSADRTSSQQLRDTTKICDKASGTSAPRVAGSGVMTRASRQSQGICGHWRLRTARRGDAKHTPGHPYAGMVLRPHICLASVAIGRHSSARSTAALSTPRDEREVGNKIRGTKTPSRCVTCTTAIYHSRL